MEENRDYLRDIAEIRSMMERTSRFRSLSGWAGVLAGVYALAGAWVVHGVLDFAPAALTVDPATPDVRVPVTAAVVLVLAIGTAVLLSHRKARARGERAWNTTARRLALHMAVPLFAGGILLLILYAHGVSGLLAPLTLVFYGLAVYNAGQFTFPEVRFMGLIQLALGLFSAYFTDYGILCWALGFGVVHIVYGIYLYVKYER